MRRSFLFACATLASAASWVSTSAAGQNASPLAGVWTLNRSLSEFPKEIGFNVDWVVPDPNDPDAAAGGGGRGRKASSAPRRQSSEDARRMQLLIGEVRNPPVRLMIVDAAAAVTITNELGQARTLHPNGREESFELQGVPFTVTAKRDGGQLVALYHVEQGRDVRYTYSSTSNPSRLVVEAQLLENGTGDRVRRVYERDTGAEVLPPARTAEAPGPASQPPGTASQPASAAFDQRPGAEFRGLKSLGILVEDFGAEAIACGLKHDAMEDALAKRLTAGGLAVRKNSDEDTYVYVNVITTSTPSAGCVSRYDAFLYSHATARLAYHDQPVLVQVSLMHRGGMGAGAAAGHVGAVLRGLEGYIDLFITQIRDANK